MSSQGMLMLVCRPLSEQWTAVCCYLELREWPPDQFLDYLFFVSHQALFESTWQDDLLLYKTTHLAQCNSFFSLHQHFSSFLILSTSSTLSTRRVLYLSCYFCCLACDYVMISSLVLSCPQLPSFFHLWSRLLFQHPWSCDGFSLTFPFLSQAFYALPSPSPTDQSWWSEHHQFLQRIFGALSIPINCWIFFSSSQS